MGVLSNLEPVRVFEHFEKICSIPHGSYNEKAVSDYCMAFARSRGLECYQDDLWNVVIIKEAAKGREADAPVIIQGHLDMVCEKDADCPIDFEKDGLALYIDGEWIKARGTTLGGDDGIAVAMGLALLDEPDMPRLELIFTVCEEVGMEGAKGINLSALKGKTMLNLDSEEEGYFLTSCAGGETVSAVFTAEKQKRSGEVIDIEVTGLSGGHSGTEINKERGNANVIMARLLLGLPAEYSLVSIDGGDKDNAIPRRCTARIVLPSKEYLEHDDGQKEGFSDADGNKKNNTGYFAAVEEYVKKTAATLKKEFFVSDSGICVTARLQGVQDITAYDKMDTERIVRAISLFPNGVCSYCQAMPDTVETSLNMGIIRTTGKEITVKMSLRSSVASRREELARRIRAVCESFGLVFEVRGSYPAWEYRPDSGLREKILRIYKEEYGREPVFQGIHAGLECGILSEKIRDLDCVSMGPDIMDIHTPKERLSIPSTQRVYALVKKILVDK